jgi:predicted nuclease of predicted toxin-antitoxin system
MSKFLIDVNLPYYFSLWNSEDFIHQSKLNSFAKDENIWNYAKENNLTIITKDADFSNRMLLNIPPPKIIHIKVGNMKIKDFFNFISNHWDEILNENKNNKLVSVFYDRIESIN